MIVSKFLLKSKHMFLPIHFYHNHIAIFVIVIVVRNSIYFVIVGLLNKIK